MLRRWLQLAVCLGVCGATTEAAAQVQLDATVMGRQKYVTVFGNTTNPDPVIQTDLFLSLPSGFWVESFASTDIHGGRNYGRELDAGFGKSWKYVDVGFFYFDLYPQFAQTNGDIARVHVDLGANVVETDTQRLRPFVRAEYYYVTENVREYSAPWYVAGLAHRWKIGEYVTLRQTGRLSGSTKPIFGLEEGILASYEASVGIEPIKDVTVRPMFKVSKPIVRQSDRVFEHVLGIDLVFHFDVVSAEGSTP